MKIQLKIADCRISLAEANDLPVFYWPQWPFSCFVDDDKGKPDIEVKIHVTQKLPDFPHENLIFDSNQGLWKLFEGTSHFLIEALHSRKLIPYIRAVVSKDYSQADLWVTAGRKKAVPRVVWYPTKIINPVMEVILLTLLARQGGVMMHAAGILTEGKGLVFTGPSGAGKSTLTDFFLAGGAAGLNDERVIIRKTHGGFKVYGTPWPGSSGVSGNLSAPLETLFFIQHGNGQHRIRPMDQPGTARKTLEQCFLPHWDRPGMEQTLAFSHELALSGKCLELAFLRQPDVVHFLKEPFPCTLEV